MKQVLSFGTSLEANFAADLLQVRGIACEVRAGEMPELAPELWVVDDADLPRALEALQDKPAASGWSWSCPKCKSENEPQFDACWSCGAERAKS